METLTVVSFLKTIRGNGLPKVACNNVVYFSSNNRKPICCIMSGIIEFHHSGPEG